MSPDTLRIVGEALHGRFWQTRLAMDLRVSDRTVRRWAAGENIPQSYKAELEAICKAKQDDIREALKLLSLT